MPLLPSVNELGDEVDRILEIAADGDDRIAVRLTHAIERGVELPKVARVEDHAGALVLGTQKAQLITGAIRGAVVDEDDVIVDLRAFAAKNPHHNNKSSAATDI